MPSLNRFVLITIASIIFARFAKSELPDRKSLKHFRDKNQNRLPEVTVHKVTLTQKGYIQFLKYMVDVPTIEDFTFCIWLRSTNLSESHPLLSYSKHEEERLVRGWIGSSGKHINLEILEQDVFAVPVDLIENKWYHVCESWESQSGTWTLFLNGRIKAGGVNVKMRGVKIPSGGDIVVGQEYTDFDKGLDDGIEGDIFGFNLVLATASSSEKQSPYYIKQNDLLAQRRQLTVPSAQHALKTPINIHNPERQHYEGYFDYRSTSPNSDGEPPPANGKETDVPAVLSYFTSDVNRNPKGFFDIGRSFWNMFDFFGPETNVRVRTIDEYNREQENRYYNMHHDLRSLQNRYPIRPINHPNNKRVISSNSRVLNEGDFNHKPLGLVLVELSYRNCALGSGSPINNDGRLIVSWTKTPVRVFGGAILKSVAPFCVKTVKAIGGGGLKYM